MADMHVWYIWPDYCEDLTWIVLAREEDQAIHFCIEDVKARPSYREDWEVDNMDAYHIERLDWETTPGIYASFLQDKWWRWDE